MRSNRQDFWILFTKFLVDSRWYLFLHFEITMQEKWGHLLVTDVLPKCLKYIAQSGRDIVQYNQGDGLKYFESQWKGYLKDRNLLSGDKQPGCLANFVF
jgi:hypothetical protein